MSAIPDYVDSVLKAWDTIAHLAYDGFERQGRGVVTIEPPDTSGNVRLMYGPGDFFEQRRQMDVIRLLAVYDPANEFLVHFQDGSGTRTLRIRTPERGRNPKGIWFFRMLALVNEQPEALPDNLPAWFFRALQAYRGGENEEQRQPVPTLDDVLNEAKRDGRICPLPMKWKELWEMLPEKKRRGAGWEPSLPLILAAWHDTPHLSKIIRLQEHIHWADEHGVLPEVYDFLRNLKAEDWYYGD